MSEVNDIVHIPVGTGLTILGVAFTAWAWVVAWGVGIIRREIGELKKDFKEATKTSMEHKVNIERRIARLEAIATICRNGEFREERE